MQFDRTYPLGVNRYAITFLVASLAVWGGTRIVFASIFTGLSIKCSRLKVGGQGECEARAGSFFSSHEEAKFTAFGTKLLIEPAGTKATLMVKPPYAEPFALGAVGKGEADRFVSGFDTFVNDTSRLDFGDETGFPLFWYLVSLPLLVGLGLVPLWLTSGAIRVTVAAGRLEVRRKRPLLPERSEGWPVPEAPVPRFSVYEYDGRLAGSGALMMTLAKTPEVLAANVRVGVLRRIARELTASWEDVLAATRSKR